MALGRRFVAEVSFRRAALEGALTTRANAYADERLQRYALGDAGWDALPLAPLAGGFPDTALPDTPEAVLELGRRVFFEYPVQPLRGLLDRTWWEHGVVEVRGSDGQWLGAATCSWCHSHPEAGGAGVTAGAGNPGLDVGQAYLDMASSSGLVVTDSERARLAAWGPGRADVTPDGVDDPVRLADLRPVRHHRHLQAAGAMRHRDVVDLAVRLETLLVTAMGRTARPPRAAAFALAAWVESLAPPARPLPEDHPGAATFRERCALCHDPEAGYSSERLVPADEVGTDERAAWSPARGTGGYRVPSLVGVGGRRPLLHDGSVADLHTLLDPGRAAGGHTFAAGLGAPEADALIALVESL